MAWGRGGQLCPERGQGTLASPGPAPPFPLSSPPASTSCGSGPLLASFWHFSFQKPCPQACWQLWASHLTSPSLRKFGGRSEVSGEVARGGEAQGQDDLVTRLRSQLQDSRCSERCPGPHLSPAGTRLTGAELPSAAVGGEVLSGQPSALPCPAQGSCGPPVPSQVPSARASEMSSLGLCGSGADPAPGDPRPPPPALPPRCRSFHLFAQLRLYKATAPPTAFGLRVPCETVPKCYHLSSHFTDEETEAQDSIGKRCLCPKCSWGPFAQGTGHTASGDVSQKALAGRGLQRQRSELEA